ncbi:DUF6179 domain-containing protein [Enterococcus gilvus]|uniref:DUF6179 domain-containing protein n=1 Tax=Enterococcus gilvus TaxID=160453 RepID=UPI001C8C1C3B|nr:DUF6179 domain-containing protein [Enterococcus gilvus]MBX8939420.1 hypothetical protein [Enterococcus gilvus]
MKNELLDPAFYPFFMKKLQERLSGSSVMPVDQAERIQQSIEFVLANGEAGNLSERFEQGKEQLKQRLAQLQKLYQAIQENYQSFGIESLEVSLAEIGNFFSAYDLEFGAAEVDQAFLDYQLAEAVPADFVGLDFYERYLHNLAAEVFFLKQIPESQVYELLEHYQKDLGFDYRTDVNNLFEIVFKQMIGKLLLGKKAIHTLLLNQIEAQYVLGRIKDQTDFPELEQLFQQNDYYRRIFAHFQLTVQRLLVPESAVHFFVVTKDRKKLLELPPAMTASRFNQLMEAYSVADKQEKIRLITSEISAPADFEEYVEISAESMEFYKNLLKEFGKNFIKVLLIFEINKLDYKSYKEIVGTKAFDGFSKLLKDYVKTLPEDELSALFRAVDEYQLVLDDFS